MGEILKQKSAHGFEARGAGSATGISAQATTGIIGGAGFSDAISNPYPSAASSISTYRVTSLNVNGLLSLNMGKVANSITNKNQVNRRRFGQSFQLAASYAPGTIFTLAFTLSQVSTQGDPFSPQVFLSNTLDVTQYSGNFWPNAATPKAVWDWEDNLDNNLGSLPALLGTWNLNVPFALLSPLFGTGFSIIVGSSADFANGGATGYNTFGFFNFETFKPPKLTIT